MVSERIVDGAILHIINLWLKAAVVEDDKGKKTHVGGGKANNRGTPQGGIISPLLANCYLHILDRIWDRQMLRKKYKAHLVRYADDFVVLCKGSVEKPLAAIGHILSRLDLTLNETKTHIVDARKASIKFLGFEISESKSWKTGNRYIHTCPSKESLAKIKTKLKEKTARHLTPLPLNIIVEGMNASLRGWANYFHYGNSSQAMGQIRTFAEERLRLHLMNRHKVKDRNIGAGRFHSQHLYARYGLYKVPTTAGWKSVHASV